MYAFVKYPCWPDKPPSGQQACLRWGQVFWSHKCECPRSCKATSILRQMDPPETAKLRELYSEHPHNHHPDSTINIFLYLLYHRLFVCAVLHRPILSFRCISPNAVLISPWSPLWFCSIVAPTFEIKIELVTHVKMRRIWARRWEKHFRLLPSGIWHVCSRG